MTTIVERRREIDLIAGFVVLVFAFAAWRGAAGAPIVAAIMALVATVTAIAWVTWRRRPSSFLAISPDEIFFGRLDQPGIRILRAEVGRLKFRRGYQNGSWALVPADREESPAISMLGFDVRQVQQACEQHGWTFG